MQIIIGIVLLLIGTLIVIKSETILSMFGRIIFFERYLGVEGGSRLGYKLIGVAFVFVGILLATKMFNGFIEWILGPLINASRQQ